MYTKQISIQGRPGTELRGKYEKKSSGLQSTSPTELDR